MKFTVSWLPSVERDLADLWINGANRAEVAAAADAVDEALGRSPLAVGESRGGSTRIVFIRPLAVLYDVDVAGRKVNVWDIWRWPT